MQIKTLTSSHSVFNKPTTCCRDSLFLQPIPNPTLPSYNPFLTSHYLLTTQSVMKSAESLHFRQAVTMLHHN